MKYLLLLTIWSFSDGSMHTIDRVVESKEACVKLAELHGNLVKKNFSSSFVYSCTMVKP